MPVPVATKIGFHGGKHLKRRLALWAVSFAVFCALIWSVAGAHDLPLTLVMRQHHEPFSYTGIHGQPVGLLVDLWRLWAECTGRSVRFVLAEGNDLENWILDGRADVWTGILPPGTHPKLLFSEPLMMLFRPPLVGTPEGALGIRAVVRSDRTQLLAEINRGFQALTL